MIRTSARSCNRAWLHALAVAGVFASYPLLAHADKKTVVTEQGPIRGVITDDGREFLGVPYAAPPVGALRWQPPAEPARHHGLFDATQFGNNCPQNATPFGLPSTTEDCLFLNIYTPPTAPHRNDPVMVWIHPGAFTVGESDDFDPHDLVQQGVVVVTINYRLGALGWLSHPALTAESPNATSGNYGLMDQQAALRWVQDNIDAFGGNPDNVTIFGESAGGVSVHAHLVSPQSAGLFQRAIAQSAAYALVQPTLAVAESQGSAYATAVGCASQDAACLRAVPVATLLAKQSTSPSAYLPKLDNYLLPLSFRAAFTSGQFNHVPVIEGSTHDEFRLFVASLFELQTGPVSAAAYGPLIAAVLGVPAAVVPIITSQYPLANYPSPGVALATLSTDAIFACNSRTAARLLSQYVPTWAYEFNDPNAPQVFLPPVSFSYGSYHGSEVQYLFDVRKTVAAPALNAQQEQLSAAMVRYWAGFARAGDPNSAQTPAWGGYHPTASDSYQQLVPATPQASTGTAFGIDHKCAFWTALSGG